MWVQLPRPAILVFYLPSSVLSSASSLFLGVCAFLSLSFFRSDKEDNRWKEKQIQG